jgi:hypothetical protein
VYIKSIIIITVLFLFSSCGYKPTSIYASNTLSDKTYVDVKIDINNALNTVLIKDALIELILGRFDTKLTSNKQEANSFVSAKLLSVSHKQLQSDDQAFSLVYRETVSIQVVFLKLNEKAITVNVSNYYDFFIDSESVVTQAKKDEAIKIAITKALSDVFAKIAVKNIK